MRVPIAAVSAFVLMTATGFAQTMTPSTTGHAGGGMLGGPSTVQRAPQPNPLTGENVSNIKGTEVYGSDDKKIGSVSTVLMKPDTKTIDRLVVGAGGVLGVGSHQVALPIDKFSWDSQKDAFKVSSTTDELKQMPQWHEQSASLPNDSAPATPMRPAAAPPAGSTPDAAPAVPAPAAPAQ